MNKLIFILPICLGLTACNGNSTKNDDTVKTELIQPRETKDHIEILYFHGKQRCATCTAIEKNAKEAIKSQFADEIKNGTVIFRTIKKLPKNTKSRGPHYSSANGKTAKKHLKI